MISSNTIAAISTPSGVGALGIIRLTGPNALSVLQNHTSKETASLEANRVYYAAFNHADGGIIDEVVITYFKAPHSFTGEDVVEISFHGSPYILETALQALLNSGAIMASPGEFTQRAFYNRKMDLSQAEAVADLIASESQAEHTLAMHQMRGGFSDEINKLREELINFASLIELELDFAEEDVEFANRDELIALIAKIRQYLSKLIDSFQYGNAIKNGVPVAIIGKPNAGKSTLLNAILNEERAIVTEIAGTTRDAIEDTIVIDGVRFRFIDTAGIRETTDSIEAIGVKKSLEKMKSAALVIYLFDLNDARDEHTGILQSLKDQLSEHTLIIAVGNKADQLTDQQPPGQLNGLDIVPISAKDGTGMDDLLVALKEKMKLFKANPGDTVVTNTRHLQALKATDAALQQGLTAIESGFSGDLVAADIREALHHLGSITGEISTEDLLGNIFGKFCIGK